MFNHPIFLELSQVRLSLHSTENILQQLLQQSLVDSTTVTVCWLDYLPTWSGVSSWFKTLQHGWSFESAAQNTSRMRSPVSIGFVFLSAFSLKSLCWPTERWTAVRLRIVLFHSRRRRSISIETTIIRVWATDSSIVQPHYGRQAGFPSFCRQSVEQSIYTPHLSTVTGDLSAASQDFSFPALLSGPNSLTLRTYILLWT